MNKVPTYEEILGKKVVVYLGNQPHLGIFNTYDDENVRLLIGDEEGLNPIGYLLPRSKITIIAEDADALVKTMEEAQKKAAAKTVEKPKIQTVGSMPGLV